MKKYYFSLFLTIIWMLVLTSCSNEHMHKVTKVEAVAATCTEAGNIKHWVCDNCGKKYSDFNLEKELSVGEEVIPAYGHEIGKISYQWREDNLEVTANSLCKHNDKHIIETETVETIVNVEPKKCLEDGLISYTATFENPQFEEQVREEVIPASHEFGKIEYEWNEDFSEVTATNGCHDCDEVLNIETVTSTYENAIVNATFTLDIFENQTVDLTDTINMTAEELKGALMRRVNEGETDITVTLTENPSIELFDAIRAGFEFADNHTINLTLAGVKNIPDYAFTEDYDSMENFEQLKTIYLPDAITIGLAAFDGCYYLEEVDAPKVITIGDEAFGWLQYLHTINFPLAEEIGNGAFEICYELEHISLPSAKVIGRRAFISTEIVSIDIPNVTIIGDDAFIYCEFVEINLPSVTSIGNFAFQGITTLEKITFGSVLTNVGRDMFGFTSDYYFVDTENIELVFAKGQKNFTGDNSKGWSISEEDIPTGENIEFNGRIFKSISIKRYDVLDHEVIVSGVEESYIFADEVIKPTVTVTWDGNVLTEGEDYEVSYGENYYVGKGTITIIFKGDYIGTINHTFNIIQDPATGDFDGVWI